MTQAEKQQNRSEYGNVLRSARTEAGLSQNDLARRARVSRSTVHNIETGSREPTTTVWFNLYVAITKKTAKDAK